MMRKLVGGSSNSRSPGFITAALAAVVFVACAVVVSASSVDANAAATTTITASACSTVDTTVENCPADIDVDDRRPSQRSSSRRRAVSSSSSQQPLFRFGPVRFDRRTINFKQRQQLLAELPERNTLVQQKGNYEVSSPSIATITKVRGGSEDDDDDDESSDDDEIEEESEEEESSAEEFDEEEEEEEEEETDWAAVAKDVSEKAIDVTQTTVVPFLLTFSQKTYKICRVLSIRTYHAFQRAYRAVVDGDDDEDDDEEEDDDEDEETSISTVLIKYATKTFKVAKRMVVAALDFSEEDDDAFVFGSDDDEDGTDAETSQEEEDDDVEEKVAVEKKDKSKKKKSKSTSGVTDDKTEGENKKQADTPPTTTKALSDAGKYLSETYDVPDDRENGKKRLDIWGGSFKDALKSAQDQARLLVVFIPATQPKSKGGFSIFGGGGKVDEMLLEKDKQAIESLFSSKVAKAAARKPLKKGDKTLGSFAVWTAKNGSPEANEVFRRMKVTETSTKGKKRPILCVVYPSFQGMSSGLPKIVPNLLVQHHSNPPPNPEDMATWLNSLRKRHPKQYGKLQRQVRDLQIYKEVKEGYEGSIKADKKREKEEAKAEAERKAKAEAEAARLAAIEERRKALLEELPDDKKGKDIKRIALRFPDGRKGERGFDPDQPVSVLLNWVDAMFESERESVILTTMNGKITLSWEEYGSSDKTLADVGLGKSTA
eukprot:CAMPEP_0113492170 /NCGR_PEP_ID=MMETSP0014_2-20120614/27933_1 /TAXON_ID=2857 /ORGANISM="Nitzschia sp." /LENGTH=713 /DNA_ID=CAMNT_0000385983 /DNA_START=45 /DNA_END=2182 /DNA_ORIENTATION=+ /assembly_acc=CAM_ASM_000159